MAQLPTEAALTGASTTNAQQKGNFAALRQFLAELLGTDSADKAAARAALGAFPMAGGTIGGATMVQGNVAVQGTVKATGLIYGRNGGDGLGRITVSPNPPSDGEDGDIWFQH
ncbi:hypothetical protein OOT46_29185 [Aquabacterium sp. A7-Y]|uniref:hypothetical protein n=1 Tax=Aquabacterium sp. A7-Y TaxID=1349605 RepID=UPI00223DB8C6|nr:hypothetical protein [Aquabacterium sp. A7-Y]MCW7541876.1 hypothetical protein [Aquabacterium sp. A7-Y]